MNLAKSILFGANGTYNFCNINVNFKDTEQGPEVFGETLFAKTANFLLGNPIIKAATFGYLHVFIHEMGHVLAYKLRGDHSTSEINVFTRTCRGKAISTQPTNLFTNLAGPILSSLWEIAKLVSATACAILLPSPLGLSLGIFLGAGSAFWLFGEVAYACSRKADWEFLA